MGDLYIGVLRKYAVFGGRAGRKEYWTFSLVNLAITLVLAIVFSLGHHPVIANLYTLAVFLPSLAVTVRRLHDTDHSGWWFLIGFVPLVGSLVLLVFMARDGQAVANRFGPDPKQVPGDMPRRNAA